MNKFDGSVLYFFLISEFVDYLLSKVSSVDMNETVIKQNARGTKRVYTVYTFNVHCICHINLKNCKQH